MSDDSEQIVAALRARVGTTINQKWRLDELLGVGGMAAVYAATHRNGKRGAVKILHPEVAANPSLKARFLREGYVANKVDHPGAVSILDDDEAPDGTVYLVMELLHGETLDAKIARRQLGFDEALSIAGHTLDVLSAAHEKGIIHRDIKPGNLFFTRDGTVKVLDFGIARLREATSAGAGYPLAVTRHSMGTPGFMPPEQARGLHDEVDARSDVWAVGATMFTALTGQPVHDGRTPNEQLLAGMTQPAPPLASRRLDAPPEVAQIVDRALAFERADRFQDAAEMRAAVGVAYEKIVGRPAPTVIRLAPSALSAEALESSREVEVLGAATTHVSGAPAARRTTGTTAGTALSAAPPRRGTSRIAIGLGAVVVGAVALGITHPWRPGRSEVGNGGAASAPPSPSPLPDGRALSGSSAALAQEPPAASALSAASSSSDVATNAAAALGGGDEASPARDAAALAVGAPRRVPPATPSSASHPSSAPGASSAAGSSAPQGAPPTPPPPPPPPTPAASVDLFGRRK